MPSTDKRPEAAMEITLDRSDLLKELSVTQGVVERKATIPILASFLFEAGDGKLAITATDLDSSLHTSCPAQVKKTGSCTVPARKLHDYVRLLQDGEVTIKLLENHWVQIRSGRSNTKMVGMACDKFPVLPSFPVDSTLSLPAQLLRTMISKTIFSISQEESRYTLNGALLVIRPDGMTMVATDGHRMSHIETTNFKAPVTVETKVLIPKKALAEIHSLLSSPDLDTLEFAMDDSTLFFRIGSRLLTSRQLTGQFPNYQAVLPRTLDKTVALRSDEFARAIQRVSTFSDIHSNSVRLKMENDHVKLFTSSSESGESEDSVETSYRGEPLQIGFNSRYLLDFLKVAGPGDVHFHFKATELAGEFRPDEPADSECRYRYIVMPLRV
jgi:DNA polymerase-3 subunit beta